MSFYSAAITLILVMDPLGNIPLFLAALRHVSSKRRRAIIIRESTIAFVILTIFLFFGQFLLAAMNITQPALSIAGGIILFLIAIRMIFPHEETKAKESTEPFIVPLAVPLIAGPSTMTVVMLMAKQTTATSHVFLALVAAWLITTVVLLFANVLRKLMGERGITAVERLMGMILTTMAVQMFLSGYHLFLSGNVS